MALGKVSQLDLASTRQLQDPKAPITTASISSPRMRTFSGWTPVLRYALADRRRTSSAAARPTCVPAIFERAFGMVTDRFGVPWIINAGENSA